MTAKEFEVIEEVEGHRWGRFTATPLLGGKDWVVCFNCGMIRRADKRNKPCRGRVQVQPRRDEHGSEKEETKGLR